VPVEQVPPVGPGAHARGPGHQVGYQPAAVARVDGDDDQIGHGSGADGQQAGRVCCPHRGDARGSQVEA